MKLTDGEKLILLMLTDMYKAMNIKGEFDPEFIANTICKDKLWGFNWELSGIPWERSEDPPEVRETTDFLDMWRFVEEGYEALTPAEKTKLAKDAEPFGTHVKFPGFDGNNEPHYRIANYMLNDMRHRFDSFKGRGDLNSHSHSVESYRRMYSVFGPIRANLHNRSLNLAELTEILNARRHPSQC
ncbi:YfbU family protein [Bradyrhizobium sp. USDA 3364]